MSGGLQVPDVAALEAMPHAMLAQIPGATPPPNVIPNFAHPASAVPEILGVSYFFLALASLCFLIRIWTKTFIVKKWQWDDYTITAGYALAIIHLVFVTRGCLYGATGRHQWEIHLDRLLSKEGTQQSYATVIVITPALGLIKVSLLIQYYLLFNVRKYIRICVWIGAAVFGTYYVVVSIVALVLNSPWNGDSLLETIVSWHYLKFAEFAIPTGAIGMAFDWFLFFLPMPAVWGLHLNMSRKIGIMLIFATGGVGAAASVVSLYYRVKIQSNMSDVTWTVGYVLLWSQIELFAGVTASSMPSVRQFFGRQELLKSWGSSLRRSLVRSSHRSSFNEDLPANVATMREYESTSATHKPATRDLESGFSSHTEINRDSASSLGKDDASVSLQSVSAGSYR